VPTNFFVYVMSSASRTLYVGVTNDIVRRTDEHRHKRVEGFAARYNCTELVYYEWYSEVGAAIAREKELKGWRRSKKVALIESTNPEWRDLWDEVTAHFHPESRD
jgi:putative endonuclease